MVFGMCLLAVQYRLVPEAPVLIAANQDAFYDFPVNPPSIQSGKPRVLCSVDQKRGGTWLGVNQNGMFASACNRKNPNLPYAPKSRGNLCREMLRSPSARDAMQLAVEELATGQYNGVNLVCADAESGWVIHGGQKHEVLELPEGLTIIGSNNMNDPRDERVAMAHRLLTLQTLDSPIKFLAVASKVLSRPPSQPGRPSIVIRDGDYGTVSSTLISLGQKPRDAIFQFADGAPDKAKFEDYSPLLRDILSRGLREARNKARAKVS